VPKFNVQGFSGRPSMALMPSRSSTPTTRKASSGEANSISMARAMSL
jgi:hypothetical protein